MSQENQIVASGVSGSSALLPLPSIDVKVREATLADLLIIDALQKKHTKMAGKFGHGWGTNAHR